MLASWFSVYSPKNLKHITPSVLDIYLRGPKVDWYILAETFGIDDDEIERVVNALKNIPDSGTLGE